jgi:hypothetical protein
VAKKSHTRTRQAIAKNALAASFLAPRALMQAGEIHQNINNLALNLVRALRLIPILTPRRCSGKKMRVNTPNREKRSHIQVNGFLMPSKDQNRNGNNHN